MDADFYRSNLKICNSQDDGAMSFGPYNNGREDLTDKNPVNPIYLLSYFGYTTALSC